MFHVVVVSAHGYSARSKHSTVAEASDAAWEVFKRTHMAVVVRDGATGKRYCLNELKDIGTND